MELINICLYATAYHSGKTYEENRTITKESYDKIKDKVLRLEVYISELDGKHSAVKAEIDIQSSADYDLTNECEVDGEDLYYELKNMFKDINTDLDAELKVAEEYLESLDYEKTFSFTFKKSQYDKIRAFIDSLREE